MAYFYVSTDAGTLTGTLTTGLPSPTTKRTGTWASMTAAQTYPDMHTCFAQVNANGGFSDGDVVAVNDQHEVYVTNCTLTHDDANTTVYVISTLSTDCEQYSKNQTASGEDTGGTLSLGGTTNTSVVVFRGIQAYAMDISCYLYNAVLEDCSIGYNEDVQSNGTNSYFRYGASYWGTLNISNSTIQLPDYATSGLFIIGRVANVYCNNVTFSKQTGQTAYPAAVCESLSIGGFNAEFKNCDFSDWGSTPDLLGSSVAGDDPQHYYFDNCKFPTSWAFSDTDIALLRTQIVVRNCDVADESVSGSATYWGTDLTERSDDTGVYRTGGASVDGATISTAVTTNARCDVGKQGHRFLLATIKADFSTAKTIDVYFAHESKGSGTSSDATDEDIHMDVLVPKSGTPGSVLYSSRGDDPLSVGTDLTNTSETWNNLTTPVQQKMSVTTAGSEGNGYAEIWVQVNIPSVSVYVCPQPDVA